METNTMGGLSISTNHHSVDIVNCNRPGINTNATIDYVLPTVINIFSAMSSPPVLITIWLGTNDASLANGTDRDKHIPIDQFKTSLQIIVTELRAMAPQAQIVLISPAIVDDDTRRKRQVANGGPSDPIDRANAQAGIEATACGDVAATLDDVTFLNLHSYLMTTYPDETHRAALLNDGLHLSEQGNLVVYHQVKTQLKLLSPCA